MSVIYTGGIRNVLLVGGVVFVASLTLIICVFYQLEQLSIEKKIEYEIFSLIVYTIIFTTLIISVNVYYTVKLAKDNLPGTNIYQKPVHEQKNLNVEHTETIQNQLTLERFSRAIEQLGNEKIETRLGAIYALERLAQNVAPEHWTIMETLAAFLRENAPVKEESKIIAQEILRPPTDIQAALTVIGRRDTCQDPKNQKLDLRYIDIKGADLTQANLQSVDLTGSDLKCVVFYTTNLQLADLTGANLQQAHFYEANLQEANFYEANLQQADLRKANLCGSIFYRANLKLATLQEADLQSAIMYEADLQNAILYEANLRGAILEGSNLQRANLIGSDLKEADLIGADLQGALLTTANCSGAIFYETILARAHLCETNFSDAVLMGSDFQEAIFDETNLCGADLTRAKYLEAHQLETAIGDRTTRLPADLEPPSHWL